MLAMRTAAPNICDCVRVRALLIAGVLFISYAYFYEGGGWNQNSRFDQCAMGGNTEPVTRCL